MKNVLITGNVMSLAAHLCQRLSRQYRMVIAAYQAPPIALGKGVDVLGLSGDKTLEHVFQAYSFQAMIFLGTRGEQQSRVPGEADLLSSALALAKRHGVGRVLYFTSGELSRPSEASSERGVLLEAMERLCTAYRRQGLEVVTVRLPCVFGSGEMDTLIGRMLDSAARGETAVLPFARDAQVDFISAVEVAQLAYRLLEIGGEPDELLLVRGAEALTVRELTALFGLLGASVSQGTLETGYPPMEGGDFKRGLGFAPAERLSVVLDSLYAAVRTSLEKQYARRGRVRSFLKRFPALVKGTSLLLGYAAVEALQMLQNANQFPPADLRLLYVTLTGAAHGLQTGLIAVVFASFSLAKDYGSQGMDLTGLINDWKAWVPFAMLVLASSMTGYAHDKGRKEARSAQEAVRALEKRCSFLQDLYKQSLLSEEQHSRQEEEKHERLEEQLAQLRKGQERLEQEWLTLLRREQARWDRERAEKGRLEEESRKEQPAAEEALPIKQQPDKERMLENLSGKEETREESLFAQADFTQKQPPKVKAEEKDPSDQICPAAGLSALEEEEDDLSDDDLKEHSEEDAFQPQHVHEKIIESDVRKKEQEAPLPNWADPSSVKDRFMPKGSPFGKLSPAERRRMLEAMQVRAKSNLNGKPKRKRG